MAMVLDDAERGRSMGQWGSTFRKSAIWEVIKLGQVRQVFLRTDEGLSLEGLKKEDEIYLYSMFAYIQNWCGEVGNGISESLGELYGEFERHGEEVYAMTRIKGSAGGIMNYIKKVLKTEDGRWNLHTIAKLKSVGTLTDVEGAVKGVQMAIVNTGGGNSLMEFLGGVKCVTSRLLPAISDRIKCHPRACPQEGNGREVTKEKASRLLYGRLLIKE